MLYEKKISYDVLHVALILVLMQIGPDILWSNPMHDVLGTGDIFIGPAVAYQQYDSREFLMGSNRYVALKNIVSDFAGDSSILRDRLDYFSHRARQNVIAYYSDRPENQQNERARNNSGTNEIIEQMLNSDNSATDNFSDSSPEQTFNSVNIDLSREDMDLIEILWKQDIDLGISREAFSIFDAQDADKAKHKAEISGCSEDFHVEENEIKTQNDCSEDDSFYKEWEGSCFTVDSETGEHMIKEKTTSEAVNPSQANNSFLSTDELEGLPLHNLITSERYQDLSLAEAFIEQQQLEEPFQVTFFPDSDRVFNEDVPKFDGFMQNTEEFSQIGEEMYPSLEEYWQDISNTLPLSVTGIASYQPNMSRMNRVFSDINDRYGDNDIPYFSSEVIQHPLAADTYVEPLSHNASLVHHRSQDINNFSCMSTASLDSTSLGCAVASSIATLTNDSESVPDVCSNLNSTYGLDLVSIFHPNNTPNACPNESFISEILFEEELQLTHMPEEGAVGESDSKILNEQVDSKNDSVNSSNSSKISSLSDLTCASIKKYANVAGTDHGKKESHYISSKYSYDQSSKSAYSHGDGSSQNSNFDLNSSHNRCNYSYYLQHNHSYHLSFINGSSLAKPITRDKDQNHRSDEEHSRDEKRAKALKLPISIDDIINLAIDEFNEKLSKFELTEPQLTLIRDIRRRGKNKVAAQNCRKRKMDQISSLQQDLDLLQAERTQLENERTELLHLRQNLRDKYSQLCRLVFQNPPNPTLTSSQQTENYRSNASPDMTNFKICDNESQGVRTKRKSDKKKI